MLPTFVVLALAGAMSLALVFSSRSLRRRFGASKALPLSLARGAVFILVTLALLDPSCRRLSDGDSNRRVIVLIDHSESMATADCDSAMARFDCGKRLVGSLRSSLPSTVEIETIPFSDSVLEPSGLDAPPAGRTSLRAALDHAADSDGDASVVVLVTDGGEAAAKIPRLPRSRLAVLGVGSDLEHCDNIRITALDAPDAVEQDTNFKIKATIAATGSAGFTERLGAARTTLDIRDAEGRWTELANRTIDLSGGSAEVEFETSRPLPGTVPYRLRVEAADGEISSLDNVRAARVEVRREMMNILYFSCRLGADLKMLRQELSSDPAISFTAAYRVGGARFAVQGDDPERTKMLEDGLPASSEALGKFDAIIFGSFPADAFEPAQEMALLEYVENGGGIVWLGGEESFEGGGYGDSQLEVLFPWKVVGHGGTLQRGEFQLAIPPSVADEGAVAGLGEMVEECRKNGAPLFVESVNAVTSLKTSAQSLVEVETEGGRAPMVAQMRVGAGRSIAVASNTTWRWGRRQGREADFYRRFCRQLSRAAAGSAEGGRVIQVSWNPAVPVPGEVVEATIRATANDGVSIRAELVDETGERPMEVLPGEEPNAWIARTTLAKQGRQRVRIAAERAGEVIEVFEKEFDLEPLQGEGYSLARRDADLRALAVRANGVYFPCEESDRLIEAIRPWCAGRRHETRLPLATTGPWFALALLAACVVEWTLRRMRGIV